MNRRIAILTTGLMGLFLTENSHEASKAIAISASDVADSGIGIHIHPTVAGGSGGTCDGVLFGGGGIHLKTYTLGGSGSTVVKLGGGGSGVHQPQLA